MNRSQLEEVQKHLLQHQPTACLYIVERHKNGAEVRNQLWRTEAESVVSDYLRKLLIDELERYLAVNDLEFANYDPWVEVTDRAVLEYIRCTEVPHCDEMLSSMRSHVDLPMATDLERIAPRFWAYAVDLSTSDLRCVYFRKSSSSKLLRPALWHVFTARGGRLGRIEDVLLTVDGRIDCIVIGRNLIIVNKASFELIFNYLDRYVEQAQQVIEVLESSGHFSNPGKLMDISASDFRKIKRLANAIDAGTLGPDFIDRAIEMKEQYGLQFDVDDARRIVVARTSVWDIIKLLADDFLASELTDSRYEVQSKRKRE